MLNHHDIVSTFFTGTGNGGVTSEQAIASATLPFPFDTPSPLPFTYLTPPPNPFPLLTFTPLIYTCRLHLLKLHI